MQILEDFEISDKGLRFLSGQRFSMHLARRISGLFQISDKGLRFSSTRDKRLSATLARILYFRQRAEVFIQVVHGLCVTIFLEFLGKS